MHHNERPSSLWLTPAKEAARPRCIGVGRSVRPALRAGPPVRFARFRVGVALAGTRRAAWEANIHAQADSALMRVSKNEGR
jgi:hypothetical protein